MRHQRKKICTCTKQSTRPPDAQKWTGTEGPAWSIEWLRNQRGPAVLSVGETPDYKSPAPAELKQAFQQAKVGHKTQDALQVHVTAIDTLPKLLYEMVGRAVDVAGGAEYDVVRISHDGTKVSLLNYSSFIDDPHPALLGITTVELESGKVTTSNYAQIDSPPILHRKEEYLDPRHPRYQLFKRLTKEEEERGLLNEPGIELRSTWEDLLVQKNLAIEDHQLRRATYIHFRGFRYRNS